MNEGKDTHERRVEEAFEGLGGNVETQRIIHTHSIHIAHKRLLFHSFIIAFDLSSICLQLSTHLLHLSQGLRCAFTRSNYPFRVHSQLGGLSLSYQFMHRRNTSNLIIFVQILEYIQVKKGCRKLQAFSLPQSFQIGTADLLSNVRRTAISSPCALRHKVGARYIVNTVSSSSSRHLHILNSAFALHARSISLLDTAST